MSDVEVQGVTFEINDSDDVWRTLKTIAISHIHETCRLMLLEQGATRQDLDQYIKEITPQMLTWLRVSYYEIVGVMFPNSEDRETRH